MSLYLVRHGRPLVDPAVPASEWSLDPAGFDGVWALRESGRLPQSAAWYSSPEPKATETAQLLTDQPVGILDDLAEQLRGAAWIDDFAATVRLAFETPTRSAHPGWESIEACGTRVVEQVRRVLAAHGDEDVVLVGHATAWTIVMADLMGQAPDLDRWESLGMPDLLVVG